MKKKVAVLLSVLTMAVGVQSFAISSQDLMNNPLMYRVISAKDNCLVYVDMNSIRGMQTMDYPNSIENITCNVYVEEYKPNLTAMDYQNNTLVSAIHRGQMSIHANKATDEIEGTFTVFSTFDQDGKIIKSTEKDKRQAVSIGADKNLFTTLHRLAAIK